MAAEYREYLKYRATILQEVVETATARGVHDTETINELDDVMEKLKGVS